MDRKERLKNKANDLPLRPGVYIMKNAEGRVIYVGKSKALRNRVTQYFGSETGHNEKTRRMVACVDDFDYMLTDSEIEALALENKLIKLYTPRYNIRLKDGKSYPYIRLERGKGSFPHLTVTRVRKNDGAEYFGPYSGIKTPYDILDTLKRVFFLPSCKYRFPRDCGKVRPCLYRQMRQCLAPCEGTMTAEENDLLRAQIASFLRGNMGQTRACLKEQMLSCSENMMFEAAALHRDRLKALDKLSDKQKVVGKPGEDYDVISVYEDERAACLCILYVRDGALMDSEYIDIGGDTILDSDAVSACLCELYIRREHLPQEVLIDYPLGEEERLNLEGCLLNMGRKISLRVPERGAKKQLCALAHDNAAEHAEKSAQKESKSIRSLMRLAVLIGMEVFPQSIESVDISNFGNEEITAGFVRFENGEPDKKGYRLYKMRSVTEQNDYASMQEAVERRISHAQDTPLPDLLLVDGGKGHVNAVREIVAEAGVWLPVFGMVKDDFHKTRALTDGENEISIAGEQAVYMLIYKIQEEVHRFAYGSAERSKRKSLKRSSLEEIKGIGPKKAAALLALKGGFRALKDASFEELCMAEGVSASDARAVYEYFHSEKKK